MRWRLLIIGLLTLLLSSPTMADRSDQYRAISRNYCDGYALIHHYYDDEWNFVFDQIIFYEWDANKSKFKVRGWYLLKGSREPWKNDADRKVILDRTKKELMERWQLDKWPVDAAGKEEPIPFLPRWQWPQNLSVREELDGTHFLITKDTNTFEIVTTGTLKYLTSQVDPEGLDREELSKTWGVSILPGNVRHYRKGFEEKPYGKTLSQ